MADKSGFLLQFSALFRLSASKISMVVCVRMAMLYKVSPLPPARNVLRTRLLSGIHDHHSVVLFNIVMILMKMFSLLLFKF